MVLLRVRHFLGVLMNTTNRLALALLVSVFALSCTGETSTHAGSDKTSVFAFVDVNVIPMDSEQIAENQTVVIADGHIVSIGDIEDATVPAGAKLMTGTDSLIPSNVPGFSIHDELAELVDVGLSPYAALRSSTTEPFAFLGELDRAGTIEVGKRADLVLLQDNPLADIAATRAISGVMLQGRWLGAEELEQGLAELAAGYETGR